MDIWEYMDPYGSIWVHIDPYGNNLLVRLSTIMFVGRVGYSTIGPPIGDRSEGITLDISVYIGGLIALDMWNIWPYGPIRAHGPTPLPPLRANEYYYFSRNASNGQI